jgi:hypothetical protein
MAVASILATCDRIKAHRGCPGMVISRRLLLLAAAAAGVACANPDAPGDLAISVTPAASSVKAGDQVDISVTVTNVGDRQHTIEYESCGQPFKVFDRFGRAADQGSGCFLFAHGPVNLAPGDSHTYQGSWRADTSSFTNGVVVRFPLSPGEYWIRGLVASGDLGTLTRGTARVTVLP